MTIEAATGLAPRRSRPFAPYCRSDRNFFLSYVVLLWLDILAFAGLATAAFALRNDSSAHKRLILLATLYISDAGFARVFGDGVHGLLGDGFWPFLAEAYLANDVLAAGISVYDFITRRRLHPAYVAGIAWTFALQLTASALYHAPGWKPVALALIGH